MEDVGHREVAYDTGNLFNYVDFLVDNV
jgi:hypothetical protein